MCHCPKNHLKPILPRISKPICPFFPHGFHPFEATGAQPYQVWWMPTRGTATRSAACGSSRRCVNSSWIPRRRPTASWWSPWAAGRMMGMIKGVYNITIYVHQTMMGSLFYGIVLAFGWDRDIVSNYIYVYWWWDYYGIIMEWWLARMVITCYYSVWMVMHDSSWVWTMRLHIHK